MRRAGAAVAALVCMLVSADSASAAAVSDDSTGPDLERLYEQPPPDPSLGSGGAIVTYALPFDDFTLDASAYVERIDFAILIATSVEDVGWNGRGEWGFFAAQPYSDSFPDVAIPAERLAFGSGIGTITQEWPRRYTVSYELDDPFLAHAGVQYFLAFHAVDVADGHDGFSWLSGAGTPGGAHPYLVQLPRDESIFNALTLPSLAGVEQGDGRLLGWRRGERTSAAGYAFRLKGTPTGKDTVVPEPTTGVLLGLGLVGLATKRRTAR